MYELFLISNCTFSTTSMRKIQLKIPVLFINAIDFNCEKSHKIYRENLRGKFMGKIQRLTAHVAPSLAGTPQCGFEDNQRLFPFP